MDDIESKITSLSATVKAQFNLSFRNAIAIPSFVAEVDFHRKALEKSLAKDKKMADRGWIIAIAVLVFGVVLENFSSDKSVSEFVKYGFFILIGVYYVWNFLLLPMRHEDLTGWYRERRMYVYEWRKLGLSDDLLKRLTDHYKLDELSMNDVGRKAQNLFLRDLQLEVKQELLFALD